MPDYVMLPLRINTSAYIWVLKKKIRQQDTQPSRRISRALLESGMETKIENRIRAGRPVQNFK